MVFRSPAAHRCAPVAPLRVRLAEGQGFVEAYHEQDRSAAEARLAVLARAGFAALLEEAADGVIVLARPVRPAVVRRAA